ncbi:MAG: phosphoribosylformylglycinamidine synthase subunit PurQ [Bacteroidetes bacterium]|nr:phosphoribosylformylglycinamidine synthase subunit PurQ [Bacteroidota bacterium]MBP7398474.1 phosphoribosylformylglycinamidine synthase subunit PurQ [Chitinophagales bacterium]MBK7108461.1 phosphoribosylformylglycinamidine synthase subunit PurQ [Bacteroidota bacterium]MBK8681070.1 phosphoribosylformylglycinamidine synthase subunit PurQ [Bacteroidota bacterium]MBP8753435.1 phosphoribosylformylglycinamidine synthase subunit PurQ [Chitinophagales bacterium]
MKFGVVTFPGSNCDQDLIHVMRNVMHCEVVELWHKQNDLGGLTTNDCVLLPGGFSYGDALRTGSIARFSPIMGAVIAHCNNGGYAIGICNGFQILCEAGLLPGILLENASQQFICKNIYLKADNNDNRMTANIPLSKVLKIPMAHGEGRYYADEETLQQVINNGQVLFRYCDEEGNITDAANPNGALYNIAGICNANRNVFGMMPHPERASEEILKNTDGRLIFQSFLKGVPVGV